MPVDVVDETGAAGALVSVAGKAADAVLSCLGRQACDLCVLLVDDERMRGLNREWRAMDKATDVLSFSQVEGETVHFDAAGAGGAPMLGDVVVSVETMHRQAAEGGWGDEEELVRLLLHGVLHLIGFDHEHDDDARTMRAEENRIVALLAERGIACAWDGDSR